MNARQFAFCDLTAIFFFGPFLRLGFDSFLFLLSASPRTFLFRLTPTLLLSAQSVLGRESGGLDFGPAGLFFRAQPH